MIYVLIATTYFGTVAYEPFNSYLGCWTAKVMLEEQLLYVPESNVTCELEVRKSD